MQDDDDKDISETDTIPVNEQVLNMPMWANKDEKAEKEFEQWSSLTGTKIKNDARWLACYGYVIVIFTLVFAATFLAALVAWAWHYITPICWHWLEGDQLSKIQSVLFSGGMGAIISGIIRAQLEKTQ